MAESVVEPRRPMQRFFCHRCNVDFETVLQDYTCPYCSSGFIERLEHDDVLSSTLDDEEYSDADMSNLEDGSHLDDTMDDSDDPNRANAAAGQPMLNDLTFLMTGGRLRAGGGGRRAEGGRSLLEQLVWMIGGGRGNVTTAGAPFVFVGAPGDYVFGGEGLDAVVTQLLGQLENSGPPPLSSDQIQAIPSVEITSEQVDANMTCSVCWDNFTLGEAVSRLECEHIFHPACITPWLQLHATCPICRRSLAPEGAGGAPPPSAETFLPPGSSSTTQGATNPTPSYSRVVVRRVGLGRGRGRGRGAPAPVPGSGPAPPRSGQDASTTGGLWSALTSQLASAAAAASRTDPASRPPTGRGADMYMDIDFD